MKWTVIHRVQLDPLSAQLSTHELHQRLKVRLRVISPSDSRLVRYHNQPVTQPRRRPAK